MARAFRYLYLGVPLGARVLTDAGHPPAVACFGPLDLPGRRWARRALGRDTLLLGLPNLGDPWVQKVLASARLDAIVSFFWPKKIPPEVLALAPGWGTHPSLLPRWRGPDPYFWTIRSGDAETGVSLFELAEAYDTGAVVAQRRVPVADDETAWSLARKLDRPALSLLRELVAQLAAGERPGALAQDEAAVTEAPEPSPEDLGVDWKDDAEAIVRLVRAAFPLGASVRLGEEDADLVAASICDETPPLGLRPSEAWRTEDGAWAVRCGTGAITLDSVADPDGEPVDLDTWLERER
ncbi:MAG: hypothetical protein H6720_30745 [Sandaracinus sp.]|nr:hypothetical protein [Sandaracinus sp.]